MIACKIPLCKWELIKTAPFIPVHRTGFSDAVLIKNPFSEPSMKRGRCHSIENQNIFWKRSYCFFKKALMMSIGTGKMVVEFFSVAISAKV